MVDQIRSIIMRYLDSDVIDDNTSILDALDSLKLIELVTELEETFDIEFDLSDLVPGKMRKLTDFVSMVENKRINQ